MFVCHNRALNGYASRPYFCVRHNSEGMSLRLSTIIKHYMAPHSRMFFTANSDDRALFHASGFALRLFIITENHCIDKNCSCVNYHSMLSSSQMTFTSKHFSNCITGAWSHHWQFPADPISSQRYFEPTVSLLPLIRAL